MQIINIDDNQFKTIETIPETTKETIYNITELEQDIKELERELEQTTADEKKIQEQLTEKINLIKQGLETTNKLKSIEQ